MVKKKGRLEAALFLRFGMLCSEIHVDRRAVGVGAGDKLRAGRRLAVDGRRAGRVGDTGVVAAHAERIQMGCDRRRRRSHAGVADRVPNGSGAGDSSGPGDVRAGRADGPGPGRNGLVAGERFDPFIVVGPSRIESGQ